MQDSGGVPLPVSFLLSERLLYFLRTGHQGKKALFLKNQVRP